MKSPVALAKIRGIGLYQQAPFWHDVVLVVGNQALTRDGNKLPHAQYTLDPQYFYRFGQPYKTTRGLIRGSLHPLIPYKLLCVHGAVLKTHLSLIHSFIH